MISVSVTVEGGAAFQEELKGIVKRADESTLTPLVLRSALDEMRDGYRAQTTPDGSQWDRLTRDYAREKAAAVGGKPLLHFSERLWLSLGITPDGDVGAINDPGYAAAVNARREFLGVPEAFLDATNEAIPEYVETGEWGVRA